MTTLTYTAQLSVVICCSCGMSFAVTGEFEARRRGDHKTFYCPAGHGQSWDQDNAEERALKRARELERRLASREEDLRATRMAREAAERSLSATKGALTKATKRAERGVCLHCHRTFVEVSRHVARQHPEVLQS